MKVAICVILLAFVVATFAQSHNVEWGKKGPSDKQLYRDIRMKSGSFLQVKEEDVAVNTASQITYMSAVDQYVDDNGGKIVITGGGVGYSNVDFHIKSKRSHGYNFIIEVWGQ